MPPPYLVSGTVRDPQRRPVSLARVYFTGGPSPLPDVAALTDAAGRFSLSAPAPGTYTVGCAADGFAPASATVDVAGNRQIDLELRPAP